MSVRAAAASSRPRLVPAHSLSWWDSPTHGGHHRTPLHIVTVTVITETIVRNLRILRGFGGEKDVLYVYQDLMLKVLRFYI